MGSSRKFTHQYTAIENGGTRWKDGPCLTVRKSRKMPVFCLRLFVERNPVHSHSSEHSHAHPLPAERGRLLAALLCTGTILIAEVIGGIMTGSLALISDAGHMFVDSLALAMSFVAMEVARRASSPRYTFGFRRVEILVALVNGISLIIICGVIITEAVERLLHPPTVDAPVMTAIALVGLVANAISALLLRRSSNINVRSAFLHVMGDLFSSVGIILAGVAMMLWGWYWLDPALSIAIAVVIVFSAWRVIREVVEVLMEAGPRHVNVDAILQAIRALPFVEDVHDLHVWTITSGFTALSCHVILVPASPVSHDEAVSKVATLLNTDYHIPHSTIQVESSLYQSHGASCTSC